MKEKTHPDIAILVLSCDKYADLWKMCFELFWKAWPNCPYPVFLGSNKLVFQGDDRIETLLSGDDPDWSTSYKKILRQISADYVFIWLEDVFITSKFDVEVFQECVTFMQQKHVKHVHFRPVPKPGRWLNGSQFGLYDKGMPYRVNVVGFWDRRYLIDLLLNGESAWDFEIMGSYRASYQDGFYCLNGKLFDYIHVVEKGQWAPGVIKACADHDIKLNVDQRKVLRGYPEFKNKLKKCYFKLLCRVPWKFRVKIMNILRKMIVSY